MAVIITNEMRKEILRVFAATKPANTRFAALDGIRKSLLTNARLKYANQLESDEVAVLLFDDTELKSGKRGFLLTNKRLYSDSIKPVSLVDIKRMTPSKTLLAGNIHVTTHANVLHPIMLVNARSNDKLLGVFSVLDTVTKLLIANMPKDAFPLSEELGAYETVICIGCAVRFYKRIGEKRYCEYCGQAAT